MRAPMGSAEARFWNLDGAEPIADLEETRSIYLYPFTCDGNPLTHYFVAAVEATTSELRCGGWKLVGLAMFADCARRECIAEDLHKQYDAEQLKAVQLEIDAQISAAENARKCLLGVA